MDHSQVNLAKITIEVTELIADSKPTTFELQVVFHLVKYTNKAELR